jgi:hypothetical protein
MYQTIDVVVYNRCHDRAHVPAFDREASISRPVGVVDELGP